VLNQHKRSGRLSSPRFRRRLLKVGGLAAVAAGAAVVSILFWNTGKSYDTPLSTEPAIVPTVRENVGLTKTEQRQVIRAASRFVQTAVRREHLAESYDLVSETLRGGFTRAEWASGNIPVQPYPVDAARWKFDYTYEDEIGLQIYVVPDRGNNLRPMVFYMTMTKGDNGRWLVDSWVPRAGTGGSSERSSGSGAPATTTPGSPVGGVAPAGRGGRIPTVWIAVPLTLLLAAFFVPVVVMTRERVRGRRAVRAYEAELARRSSDSSSPS